MPRFLVFAEEQVDLLHMLERELNDLEKNVTGFIDHPEYLGATTWHTPDNEIWLELCHGLPSRMIGFALNRHSAPKFYPLNAVGGWELRICSRGDSECWADWEQHKAQRIDALFADLRTKLPQGVRIFKATGNQVWAELQ